MLRPSTSGYANEVDALFIRYEARDAAAVHAPWAAFFPPVPARVLDIGAGTGSDAAWLADILPDLSAARARDEAFDMVLTHVVWMHLTEAERIAGMAHIASLMKRGARLFMNLRHGTVPKGRRMFDVTGEETITLTATHGLTNLFHDRALSIQAGNRKAGIEWTKLVFEKN
jgi:SAM-dependent methyltransferase